MGSEVRGRRRILCQPLLPPCKVGHGPLNAGPAGEQKGWRVGGELERFVDAGDGYLEPGFGAPHQSARGNEIKYVHLKRIGARRAEECAKERFRLVSVGILEVFEEREQAVPVA